MEKEHLGFWSRRKVAAKAIPVEAVGANVIWGMELIRADLVNPQSGFPQTSETYPEPILTKENTPDVIIESLQHSGDFGEGFLLAMISYYALTLASTKKIPEKVRIAAATIASSSFVGLVEMGVIFDKQPDALDVPAGIAGGILWIGAHTVGKKIMNNLDNKRQEKLSES